MSARLPSELRRTQSKPQASLFTHRQIGPAGDEDIVVEVDAWMVDTSHIIAIIDESDRGPNFWLRHVRDAATDRASCILDGADVEGHTKTNHA